MALYIIAVQGNRPISGPIAGALAERLGPRWCLAISAGSLLVVGVPTWALLVRGRTAKRPPRTPAFAAAGAGGE